MARKMNLDLAGVVYSDEVHSDVGASAFVLDHDFFTQVDLVIRTAAAGGGTLLVEDTDYQLSEESTDDAGKGTSGLSTRVGSSVYHKIQVINATYQTGALYFSGKYVADSADAGDWNIPLLIPQPWLKSLAALFTTALHTGTATTDVSMALKDTGEDFTDVAFGDIVRNTASHAFATVLYKSGTDTLYLDADIFPAGTEAYAVYAQPVLSEQTGLQDFIELTGAKLDGDGTVAADTNTLNHLLDADGTDWSTICAVGDWAMNLATGKLAQVTVVAAHDLTLQWDAFPGGTEAYMIFAGTVTVDDPNSPLDGEIIPEMNVGGRYFGGRLSPGNAEDDRMQGHWHTSKSGASTGATGIGTLSNILTQGSDATTHVIGPVTDGTDGTPRTGEDTRPRTLGATMIVRIK